MCASTHALCVSFGCTHACTHRYTYARRHTCTHAPLGRAARQSAHPRCHAWAQSSVPVRAQCSLPAAAPRPAPRAQAPSASSTHSRCHRWHCRCGACATFATMPPCFDRPPHQPHASRTGSHGAHTGMARTMGGHAQCTTQARAHCCPGSQCPPWAHDGHCPQPHSPPTHALCLCLALPLRPRPMMAEA